MNEKNMYFLLPLFIFFFHEKKSSFRNSEVNDSEAVSESFLTIN